MGTLLIYLQKPLYQVFLSLIITALYLLVFTPKNVDNLWSTSAVFYIGFIVLNSIFILHPESPWRYFFVSMGLSVLYILALGFGIPALVKILDLKGSGEAAMALLFVIYHPVFLLAIIGAKWIYLKLISDQIF